MLAQLMMGAPFPVATENETVKPPHLTYRQYGQGANSLFFVVLTSRFRQVRFRREDDGRREASRQQGPGGETLAARPKADVDRHGGRARLRRRSSISRGG